MPRRYFNSLAPGKFEWNLGHVIFKQILVIDGWGTSCEIALICMSLDFTDDQPTLVQVMAWCRQATSHYLSQCWPRSLSPYGVTRPQWVKPQWVNSGQDNILGMLWLCPVEMRSILGMLTMFLPTWSECLGPRGSFCVWAQPVRGDVTM